MGEKEISHTYVHACMNVIYVCLYAGICACVYEYVCVCIYIEICICIYECMYV